ncbi:MAG TPA: bacillithiol biosynthesis cysteine-adding enzyme BshC [Bacteroidia bacterium]|nr:bacillithiol biosynthesis cysteine-adding enzyme BshC [Bacteroidia bacterium]HNS11201.1 bacillithiol biosynthesis cysteine-adding enzyme BshC [Bacteroidia bacterium]
MKIFDKHAISLIKTGIFDELILDYLKNDEKIRSFYAQTPDPEGLSAKMISRPDFPINRSILVNSLQSQYKDLTGLPNFEAVSRNIEALKDENTFTICTGHQLNIFTGPLYTVFKMISTIRTAQKMEAETGNKIVPVFWMASEDHDMDEINHLYLYGQRYQWNTVWKGASGHAPCTGLHDILEQLKSKFMNDPYTEQWIELLQNCFKPEFNLANATRKFIHSLFGKYGLVVIDADNRELKKEFIPEMLNDITMSRADKLVHETIEQLSVNYKIQVRPRPVNLFYLSTTERIRIDLEGDKYFLQDRSRMWNKTDLENEIKDFPERFSPNVVLRPMFQEKILPNIAMIGGPGELAYWLELKSLFTASSVSYPVLLLRNSAMFIDAQTWNKLNKFGIEFSGIFESADDWIRNYVKQDKDIDQSIDASKSALEQEFERLVKRVEEIDHTLVAFIEAEKHKLNKVLKTLEDKIVRSVKKKNESEINQIYKLHEKIFPHGALQERSENVLSFLFKYGEPFIDELCAELDPLNSDLTIFKAS